MENNKQDKGFKIAALAIIVVFATLFYMEYARSSRYLPVSGDESPRCVFDTKTERFILMYQGNIKDYNKIKK